MRSRREQEKQTRRNYILSKARTLFAEKGYIGTSMSEIAEASEFAVGTLYTFFESKEQILANLFENHINKLHEVTETIRDNPELTPRQKIETGLEAVIRTAVDNLDFYRIYWGHARGVEWGSNTQVGEYIERATTRYHGCIREVFEKAVEIEDIDPSLNPDFLTFFFRMLVRSSARQTMLDENGMDIEASIRQAKKMLFDGIEKRQ